MEPNGYRKEEGALQVNSNIYAKLWPGNNVVFKYVKTQIRPENLK